LEEEGSSRILVPPPAKEGVRGRFFQIYLYFHKGIFNE